MVHSQQVEESRLRKSNREAKKSKSFEGSSSTSRLDFQDKPKFKKSFSVQVLSNFSKNRNDRDFSPNPQEGRNVDPPKERPTCGKCGKKHGGEHLFGTNRCYGCGKGVHMVNDCPNVRSQGKGNNQAQHSGPSSEAP